LGHGDDARLRHHDALALRVDERVRRAEVDGEVVREPAEDVIHEHVVLPEDTVSGSARTPW
jgi:hypothetical protein